MDTKIDIRKAMRVFEHIRNCGERTQDGYRLNGLYTETGFDGYTITLFNAKVHLSIGFHNKYHLEYKDRHSLLDFLDQLSKIANQIATKRE